MPLPSQGSLSAADPVQPYKQLRFLKHFGCLAPLLPNTTLLRLLLLFKRKKKRKTVKLIKAPTNDNGEGRYPLLGLTDCSSLLVSWSPRHGAQAGCCSICDHTPLKRLLGLSLFPTPVSSLEALCHVGQGDGKGLHGGEGVLEVQNVRAAVDPPKLHHLPPLQLDLEVLS